MGTVQLQMFPRTDRPVIGTVQLQMLSMTDRHIMGTVTDVIPGQTGLSWGQVQMLSQDRQACHGDRYRCYPRTDSGGGTLLKQGQTNITTQTESDTDTEKERDTDR